jgi:peroxiredoxin
MIKVTGTVFGTDGKPIPLGRIFLTYPSDTRPIKTVEVKKDGRFNLEIDSEGLWILHFIGIYHNEYPIAIFSDKPKEININVKLETYHYAQSLDRVKIIGNFNNWNIPRAISMHKEPDGTYTATVNNNSDTLFYRLVYVRTDGEIAGTDADGYIPNGIEGYTSYLLNAKGEVKIKFDPKKLINSNGHESFKFSQPYSLQSKFAEAYATLVNAEHDFKISLYTHTANRQIYGFRFDFAPYLENVKHKLEKAVNGLIKQVLQLSYFSLNYMSSSGHYVNVGISRKTLKIIPLNSVVWSLNPHAILESLTLGAFTSPERDKYIHKVLDTNPMERTKEILISDIIDRKFHSLEYNDILPYLSILLDQYGNSQEAINLGKLYSDYIKLKPGIQAPSFSIPSSIDTADVISDISFDGQYYLIFFWSKYDKPSLVEIDNISNAYRKFHDKNFEVISILLDSTSQDTANFKINEIKLPWNNQANLKGFNSKLCKEFEVYSVPKAILVAPDKKIVAIGWELRGDGLDKVLIKNLKNR